MIARQPTRVFSSDFSHWRRGAINFGIERLINRRFCLHMMSKLDTQAIKRQKLSGPLIGTHKYLLVAP